MQTKAIILKKQPTKEYDQLVTCYSQELGKCTAVAKSSLKPTSIQGMHLDTLNLVEFDLINGRTIPIITGAHSIETFQRIKSSLPHTAVASFFLEVIDRIAYDHQKDEYLWDFLLSTVRELEGAEPATVLQFLREKQLVFLNVLGYAPTLPWAASATSVQLNEVFEYTFGTTFHSLQFLNQVV